VLESETHDARRDRRDAEQPCQAFVGGLDPAPQEAAEEATDDAHPVLAEKDEQGYGRVMLLPLV